MEGPDESRILRVFTKHLQCTTLCSLGVWGRSEQRWRNTFTWFSDFRDWTPCEAGPIWVTRRTTWKGGLRQLKERAELWISERARKIRKRKPPHDLEKSWTEGKRNRMKPELERWVPAALGTSAGLTELGILSLKPLCLQASRSTDCSLHWGQHSSVEGGVLIRIRPSHYHKGQSNSDLRELSSLFLLQRSNLQSPFAMVIPQGWSLSPKFLLIHFSALALRIQGDCSHSCHKICILFSGVEARGHGRGSLPFKDKTHCICCLPVG